MLKLTERTVKKIESLVKQKSKFKCRVSTEESKLVQELLFKNGVGWSKGLGFSKLNYLDAGSLTIGWGDCYIISCWDIKTGLVAYNNWEVVEVTIETEEVVKTFTNMKEVMEALLAGKVLVSKNGNALYKMVDGEVVNRSKHIDKGWTKSSRFPFYLVPSTEYIEPKQWYEQIPKEGVLCWVWDAEEDEGKSIDVVVAYCTSKYDKFQIGFGSWWKHAKPVTQEEVNKLIYRG